MSDSVAEHYMGEVEKRNKRIAELEAERDRLREALQESKVKLHDYSTSIGQRIENAVYVINSALEES